jgi:hypothetical protein
VLWQANVFGGCRLASGGRLIGCSVVLMEKRMQWGSYARLELRTEVACNEVKEEVRLRCWKRMED